MYFSFFRVIRHEGLAAVTESVKDARVKNYGFLLGTFIFAPIAVETLRVLPKDALK
jgi:hypothetical protein